MRTLILFPPHDLYKKWGILAHVDDTERKRILDVPHGQFKGEIARLTKEVHLLRFPPRKKSIVSESWYNSNKPKPYKEPSHDDTTTDE